MKTGKYTSVALIALAALVGLGSVGECNNDRTYEWESNASGAYFKPNWTPDGAHIVFDRYVVDVEGTNLRSIVPDSQMGGEFDLQTSTNVSLVEPIVAYTTLRHGNGIPGFRSYSWDIVTSALDGSSYERLTSEGSREVSPIWSPDGARIAFFSDGDTEFSGRFNLFVMDSDGSNVGNLTPSIEVATDPVAWSPAGDRIAFWVKEMKEETDGKEYPYDHVLHVIDADGSNMRTLNTTGNPLAWSPDGRKLAFMPERRRNDYESPRTIVVVNVDEELQARTITIDPPPEVSGENITDAGALTWAEDGSDILFVSCHSNPNELRTYSVNATGPATFSLIGRWHALAECISHEQVAWSPDRSLIAVWEDDSRWHLHHKLFVIYPDGTGYQELAIRDEDGRWIAANAQSPSLAEDISACSEGFVVPRGDLYVGLIRDCETLLEIANELVGANVPLNWGADEKIDTWEGVVIGGDSPRITGLSFDRIFGFTGGLPADLVKLTALETFSIEGGSIPGTIPPHLANLKNLRHLTLGSIEVSGPIPPELGDLTNLETLSLYDNNLSGPIPSELGDLTNLETLILSSNNLSGPIPPELGDLTNLESLWLNGNYLSGPIPPELAKLVNLQDLFLSNNLLEGEILRSVIQIPTLHRVRLKANNLTGCVPAEFLNDWRYEMDDEIEACEDN